MKKLIITFLTAVTGISVVAAQNEDNKSAEIKKQYKATEITAAPDIDGLLDENVWKQSNWDGNFTQNEPYNGKRETQLTQFAILFDKDNLYVGIKAFDTAPDSIVNRLTRRDQVDGDLVAIIFDSFHDLRTGFMFGASSSGVKLDQMFTNDGDNEDASWDPNWWVRTSVNEEGWVAEMRIPFSQVRFEKNSGDIWGLQVARILFRNNETTFWQHVPRDAPGFVHLMGEMSGLEQIKPRKIFDVTPYTVARAETFESEPGNPFLSKGRLSQINGGIDAKIGITNNMTMDLTINPDFGQVEADPSEVNLTAYETFFSEKRPFFIEGKNITNFGLGIGDGGLGNDNLFYSRRIGRRPAGYPDLEEGWHARMPSNTTIIGAAKLTGKTKDGLSIGFVEAMTAGEKAEVDTIGGRKLETIEPLTNYLVGRVQKDFNEGKTIIGGIFTGTNRVLDENLDDFMHKAAYSGGFDFTQYMKDKSWMFNVNSAFSLVQGTSEALVNTQRSSARYFQRPDRNYAKLDSTRTSLAGSGGRMMLSKNDGHWRFMAATLWKTPGFETNDLGFIRETDQITSVFWAMYTVWDPKWIYRSWNINADIFSAWNFGGDNLVYGFEWNASMKLKNFWNLFTGGNFESSGNSYSMLRGGPMMKTVGGYNIRFGFSSDNRKKLTLSSFNMYNAGYRKNEKNLHTEIQVSYKPVDFLSLSIEPGIGNSFSELQYVTNNIHFNGSGRYIFASIDRKTISTSFRANLNFSPNLSFQYWGQPFIATGRYYDYKHIIQPMAGEYSDRFHTYTQDQISYNDGEYSVDEDVDGTVDYTFSRPDFNVREFLSNFVVRWEYNPGSSLFLVWSQTRSSFNDSGRLEFMNDLGNLFDAGDNKPHNVFLIKFSYRFGLK